MGFKDSSGSRSLGRPRCDITITLAPRLARCASVGAAARTRESSAMVPLAMGTLRSSRTRTRLPATSTEVIEAFRVAAPCTR